MIIYTSKICSTCLLDQPITEYYKNNSKCGYRSRCKSCIQIYQTSRKDIKSEYDKEYRKDKEISVERREYLRIKSLEWNKRNVGHKNYLSAKRRASKKFATPFWSETTQILELFKYAKYKSGIDGCKYQVDHIIPLQSDLVCGLHVLANLQILEASENLKKGNSFYG